MHLRQSLLERKRFEDPSDLQEMPEAGRYDDTHFTDEVVLASGRTKIFQTNKQMSTKAFLLLSILRYSFSVCACFLQLFLMQFEKTHCIFPEGLLKQQLGQ